MDELAQPEVAAETEAPESAEPEEIEGGVALETSPDEGTETEPVEEPEEPDVIELSDLDEKLANRKVKQKVNGEELELTVKEWIEGGGRLGRAAMAKFREAKEERDAAEATVEKVRAVIAEAKTDPLGLIKRLGPDTMTVLYRQVLSDLQRDNLPEDERRKLELDERHKSLEERERQIKEAQEEREREAEEQRLEAEASQHRERIVGEYRAAMDAVGFPKDQQGRALAVQMMAQLQIEARRRGAELSASDAAGIVAAELGTKIAQQKQIEAQKKNRERLATKPAPAKPRTSRREPIVFGDQMNTEEFSAWLNSQR